MEPKKTEPKKIRSTTVYTAEVNVSGKVFTVLRETLSQFPKDSLIHIAFFARLNTPRDDQGRVFVECDPKMFQHILCLVRTGALPPTLSSELVASVIQEAKKLRVDIPHIVCGTRVVAVPLEARKKFGVHVQSVHSDQRDVVDFVNYMQYIRENEMSTVSLVNNPEKVYELATLFGCKKYFCKYTISNDLKLKPERTYIKKTIPPTDKIEGSMFFQCEFVGAHELISCHLCECTFVGQDNNLIFKDSTFENCKIEREESIINRGGNKYGKVQFF